MTEAQVALLKKLDSALEEADAAARELHKVGWPKGLPSDVQAALLARLGRLQTSRREVEAASENLIALLSSLGVNVDTHHSRVGIDLKRLLGRG